MTFSRPLPGVLVVTWPTWDAMVLAASPFAALAIVAVFVCWAIRVARR